MSSPPLGGAVSAQGFDPVAQTALGRSPVRVSALGIGAGTQANAGGMAGVESMLSHAWDLGLRYVDTAPLYLDGESERRVGAFAARHDIVVSTKVGRLPDGAGATAFSGARHFDYSAARTRASLEASLKRLGRDVLDLVVVHDLDSDMHGTDFERVYQQVVQECWPVLEDLRRDGVIRALGVSSRQSDVCLRALDDMAPDCFMMAGSYTLLNHEPARDLFPRCVDSGVSVVIASPYNSGILATGSPSSTYDYGAPPAGVVDRVARLVETSERHGIPLAAAALQFPLHHDAVAGVVVGHRTAAEVDRNVSGMQMPIPDGFWADLRDLGLIPAEGAAR